MERTVKKEKNKLIMETYSMYTMGNYKISKVNSVVNF